MAAKTFADLCDSNSEATFISNALPWAQALSSATELPVDLIFAEWIAEGANSCTSDAVQCNNPGNAGHGSYCTGLVTQFGACSVNSTYYGAPNAEAGISQQGDIINNVYSQIAAAFAQSSLTAGGQELYNYASTYWTASDLRNGTYNAAYQWGEGGSCGVWASSHYEATGGNKSSVPGSGLIQVIFDNHASLSSYDKVWSCGPGSCVIL